MFAAALNRDAAIRVLLAHGADPNISTAVHELDRVRFDQDGNVVEDRPAGRGGAPAKSPEVLDAEAAAALAKVANDAAKAELDVFSRALNFKTSVYLTAKPRARPEKSEPISWVA
jgi:hypothetical protein